MPPREPENIDQRDGGDRPDEPGRAGLWRAVFALVAVSLWVQWLGPGAAVELRSEDGSMLVFGLHLLPLAAVGSALLWRHPAARLAVVPVSFLPGLALLPDAEWRALADPESAVLAVGTFAVYLVVAAHQNEGADTGGGDGAAAQTGGDEHAGVFRRFVAIRFSAVGVLFLMIGYALFVDSTIAASFAELDGASATRNQRLFAAVVAYFGWMIAVYVAAVLPSLNWERQRRRAISETERELLSAPRRLGRRIYGWLGALLVATLVALFFLF